MCPVGADGKHQGRCILTRVPERPWASVMMQTDGILEMRLNSFGLRDMNRPLNNDGTYRTVPMTGDPDLVRR